MKNFIIAAAAVFAMLAQPVFAQSAPPPNGSGSPTSGSTSQSNTTVIAIAGGKGEFGGTYNTPAAQSVRYSGHEWSTPGVQGSYFGGTNPCLVGTGGGVAGGPIGISFNSGHNDVGCTRRSDAAAWHAMGFDNVAVARMCQGDGKGDTKNADAFFASTGYACPGTGGSRRYRLADGSPAPEIRLVSGAAALPPSERIAALDLNSPVVQQAIKQQAAAMAKQMAQQMLADKQFDAPAFGDKQDAPANVNAPVPGVTTGK